MRRGGGAARQRCAAWRGVMLLLRTVVCHMSSATVTARIILRKHIASDLPRALGRRRVRRDELRARELLSEQQQHAGAVHLAPREREAE